MMNEMRAADAAKEAKLQESVDPHSPVNEAIMHEDVANTEQRHPRPSADEDGARQPVKLASDDDEPCRDRCMEDGQEVVSLEASNSR